MAFLTDVNSYDSSTALIGNEDTNESYEERVVEESVRNNDNKLEFVTRMGFLQELCDSSFTVVALLYILFSFIYLVSLTVSALNISPDRNEVLDTSVINISAFNVLILVVTIVSLYVTKKYRRRDLSTLKARLFFYTMTLPVGIWALIYVIVYVSEINNGTICVSSIFTKYFGSTELFVIISGLLIIENKMNIALDQLPWFPRSVSNFTVTLLIISFVKSFFWDMTSKNNKDFTNSAHMFFNVTFNSFVACKSPAYSTKSQYFVGSVLSLGVPLFSGLMVFTLVTDMSEPLLVHRQQRGTLNSAMSVFIGIVTLLSAIIPLLAFVIEIIELDLSKWPETTLTFLLALLLIRIMINMVGIVSTKLKLNDITQWHRLDPSELSTNLFDRYFVWIGCLGQLLSLSGNVTFASFQLYAYFKSSDKPNNTTHLLILFIIYPSSILSVLQTLYQSCLIELCFVRKWQLGTRTRKIYPSLVLMFVNIACFTICTYEDLLISRSLMENNMMITLLSSFTMYSSKVARMLQYLHAIIYFYMLSKLTEFQSSVESTAASHRIC